MGGGGKASASTLVASSSGLPRCPGAMFATIAQAVVLMSACVAFASQRALAASAAPPPAQRRTALNYLKRWRRIRNSSCVTDGE